MRAVSFILISVLVLSCTIKKEQVTTVTNDPVLFVPNDLEAALWAESPLFYNPTNMDVDIHGRIWITEAVNYRDFKNNEHKAHAEGDRIMILEDTNDDGIADSSKVFVQDEDLKAPTGIAVIGNKVVVSCSPSIIVYTDENLDDKPDNKKVFLTGFGGKDHDHGVHAGLAGPDGKWYFIAGNAGPHIVTDKAGWTLRAGSVYNGGSPYSKGNKPAQVSDDGKIWTGGIAFRINPDGKGLEVVAHNFRNSYEMYVDSFGNFWQNDNDDQVASNRTTFLLEGGNAGSFSADGRRTWQADRRPGQSIQTAHWHQEDPGVIPSGDVYGSGSPTGIVINESDALGEHYRGLLLNADAGRNIIFGYMPELEGAGYPLKNRVKFISSVEDSNKEYYWRDVDDDKNKWFRPSDVTIGTDGAIYVADWYDPIVGGHQMLDKKGYGRIYRITPKKKKLTSPVINLNITKGQVQALLSPATNVRNQGFVLLKAQGEKVLPDVEKILASDNPYHRARAVWLLSNLGEAGVREVEKLLTDDDLHIRITALRALRLANPAKIIDYARQLAGDESPAVRRAVAIAMKDISLNESRSVLLTLVDGYDGKDPWYLTALGIALEGKEEAFYLHLLEHFEAKEPVNWPEALANLVCEIHPFSAVQALYERAASDDLSTEKRKKALVALAFIPSQAAADATKQLGKIDSYTISKLAQYWLQFRKTNEWQAFLKDWQAPTNNLPDPRPELLQLRQLVANKNLEFKERLSAASQLAATKEGKLHLVHLAQNLPDTLKEGVREQMMSGNDRYVQALIANHFKQAESDSYNIEAIAELAADVSNGKSLLYSNCLGCHKMEEAGGELGPILTNIHTKHGKSSLIDAIVHPDAGIEFGSEAFLITLKNGAILYGVLLSNGPVVTIMDIYGAQHIIESSQILSREKLKHSPMPSPQHMQLSEQDIADITAYLLQRPGV